MDAFDFVIVGSGAAASVLAARLSEDGTRSLCVLEAGPPDSSRYIRIPAGFMKTIFDPEVTFQYLSEPSEGTAGRRVLTIQGRIVGGGGTINGMMYVRGQPQDFDGWAASGNPGWSYAEVLPYFKRTECRMGTGDDRYRGRDGPLPVTSFHYPNLLCDAFMESAVACGIPRNNDYNGPVQFGTGQYQTLIRNGRRVSAAHAFLHPAVRRGGVDLRTHAHASRIRFDGRRAMAAQSRSGVPELRMESFMRGPRRSRGGRLAPFTS
ncbi:MAG: hypothetical protein FJY55_01145 [Betaproteobacteria bacterium]|nr:hypothetical protein [Betaproteobacteria bacterium]